MHLTKIGLYLPVLLCFANCPIAPSETFSFKESKNHVVQATNFRYFANEACLMLETEQIRFAGKHFNYTQQSTNIKSKDQFSDGSMKRNKRICYSIGSSSACVTCLEEGHKVLGLLHEYIIR